MIELKIERVDVNVELLDAQLRALGDNLFYGLSIQRNSVILYLNDAASSDLQKTLAHAARQHDSTQMTPQQEAHAARQSQIEQGRTQTPLDAARYADSPTLIQALAAKIAWLEQEMRDLRGL
jgi:hypothetical protein